MQYGLSRVGFCYVFLGVVEPAKSGKTVFAKKSKYAKAAPPASALVFESAFRLTL